ncbi:YgfZ/GcvT domain-containing protein [Marinobacter sp. VGCF2001]|uniref:CAF17-like 4Fe-4S cluster assembly/insertion protein YgfZ n=1 Tax=Marinobacter sp. VGCF2001 TaxID=3417189 RepID=UPI003CFA4E35
MTNADTPAQPPLNGWARLTDRVMARISGPGTDKFVQGQFSQNVDEVTPTCSLRAAACTPKGRAYCLTRLVRDGDDLLLCFDRAFAEETIRHLNKYLMLFRGTTLEQLDSGRILGLVGVDTATEIAGPAAGDLTAPGQVARTGDGFLIRVEDDSDHKARFEFWQSNATETSPAGRELPLQAWHATEISAGVPWLSARTKEAYVPQMLNLQHLQGIHFKKGCYTGQEVIARMHFLGQLKKSLYRLAFADCDFVPEAGTRLMSGTRAVGEVVNAVASADRSGELLAVIRHDAAAAPLALEGYEQGRLTVLTLPYPVPEREQADTADT